MGRNRHSVKLPVFQFLDGGQAPAKTISHMLKKILRSFPAVVWISCAGGLAAPAAEAPFRPPAVPLVTSDPYLSIWSEADHLTDDVTRHWTHRSHSLDQPDPRGWQAYRLMGNEPAAVPALPQIGLEVTADPHAFTSSRMPASTSR